LIETFTQNTKSVYIFWLVVYELQKYQPLPIFDMVK
jgi:hypothetical protein